MFSLRKHPFFLFLFFTISLAQFDPKQIDPQGAQADPQGGQVPPELLGGGEQAAPNDEAFGSTATQEAQPSYNSPVLILAAKRTNRRDPSDGFRYYKGGWNITDQHYINSLVFSAAGPFVTGAIWFVFFGICLLCICCRRCCCCVKKQYGYSRAAYAISLILLILLTLAAIIGTGFLYAGQSRFNSSLVNTISYVLKEGDEVIVRLRDLVKSLMAAKDLGVAQNVLPNTTKDQIDTMQLTMDQVIGNFRNVTTKSSTDIRHFMTPLRRALIYLAAILLILAVLGFVFSILGLSCFVYSLVIIGWILVVGTFILSGMFLLVYNGISDTCLAMDEWLQNPNTTSALESLIPKVDPATAQQISQVTKGVTFGTVNVTNSFITFANVNPPPDARPPFYNQSGPLVPILCSPYTPDLTDKQCGPGEVSLGNASQALQPYVCQASESGICTTRGRLTPKIYNDITATANVSYGLYSGMPFVIQLIDSTFLKETFSHITKKNCPSLRRYTKWMYFGFITSSSAVMCSLILWVIYARERRHRSYTKKIDSSRHSGNYTTL